MFLLFNLTSFISFIRFDPFPISALSGTGTGELLDLVCAGIEKVEVLFHLRGD